MLAQPQAISAPGFRLGFSLLEVMISVAILATVLTMAMQGAVAATGHDLASSAKDDLQDDIEVIRERLISELSLSGWLFPGSDPDTNRALPGNEVCLVKTGDVWKLPISYDTDKNLRYWPKVVSERMQLEAASPATYMALHPDVRYLRLPMWAYRDHIERVERDRMGELGPGGLPIDGRMGREVVTPTAEPAADDDTRIVCQNRYLIWLRTIPDVWSKDPSRIHDSPFYTGEWDDAQYKVKHITGVPPWSEPRPTDGWASNAKVGVLPISGQYEDGSGTGIYNDLHTSSSRFGDSLRYLDIHDAKDGVKRAVTSIDANHDVSRAYGVLMQTAALKYAGGTFTLVPQWDTVAAPKWEVKDADHDRWRDRGLFLVRSPLNSPTGHGLGRLVIAAKVDFTDIDPKSNITNTIGTEPGQRLSARLAGGKYGFAVLTVLSDNVVRLTCDTWRTTRDTTLGMDICDIRIRLWLARVNRGDPGGGLIIERSTINASMRAKTSEEDRQIDRDFLTRLDNASLNLLRQSTHD